MILRRAEAANAPKLDAGKKLKIYAPRARPSRSRRPYLSHRPYLSQRFYLTGRASAELAMASSNTGPATAPPAPHAVRVDEGYTQDTRDAFDIFIEEDAKKSKVAFTTGKLAEYKYWIENPKDMPQGSKKCEIRCVSARSLGAAKLILSGPIRQRRYNQRIQALKFFLVLNGRLYYKASSASESPRRVVPISESFDRIKEAHASLGHCGYVKVFKLLNSRFYGITKEQINWLINRCQTCLQNQPNRSRGQLTPIVSMHILHRVQIDLIDMRAEPDGQYNWILHIGDHFSKFSSLFPLRSKSAEEVADVIAMWIGMFEPPVILQCDNGGEFKGVLLILLRKYGIKVINGRPRTPTTQGFIEQANGTVKRRMRALKIDLNSNKWASMLCMIALMMNRSTHGATKTPPYEIMFGRKTRWNDHITPGQRLTASLDEIMDENGPDVEESTPLPEPGNILIDPSLVDDPPHLFTTPYTFDLDVTTNLWGTDRTPSTSADASASFPPQPAPTPASPLDAPPASPCTAPPASSPPAPPASSPTDPPASPSAAPPASPRTAPPASASAAPPASSLAPAAPPASPPAAPARRSKRTIRAEQHLAAGLRPDDIPWRANVEYTPQEIEVQANNAQARALYVARHSRRFRTEAFAVGDYVTVKVDRMDRTSTDNLRAFCKVGQNNKYRLLSKLGF